MARPRDGEYPHAHSHPLLCPCPAPMQPESEWQPLRLISTPPPLLARRPPARFRLLVHASVTAHPKPSRPLDPAALALFETRPRLVYLTALYSNRQSMCRALPPSQHRVGARHSSTASSRDLSTTPLLPSFRNPSAFAKPQCNEMQGAPKPDAHVLPSVPHLSTIGTSRRRLRQASVRQMRLCDRDGERGWAKRRGRRCRALADGDGRVWEKKVGPEGTDGVV